MQKSCYHIGTLNYTISTKLIQEELSISLKFSHEDSLKLYRSTYIYEKLPIKIQNNFDDIDSVYEFLSKKSNYELNFVSGQIMLVIRSIKENNYLQKKLGLKLQLIEQAKLHHEQSEIEKLKEENHKLKLQNEKLKNSFDESLNQILEKDSTEFFQQKVSSERDETVVGAWEKEQVTKDNFELKMEFFKVRLQDFKQKFEEKRGKIESMKKIKIGKFQYRGYLKDGVQNGYGIRYYSDGCILHSEFKNGSAIGMCVTYFSTHSRFEGQVQEGLKNGLGIFYYPNREVYEGQYFQDKRHGVGILYNSNGFSEGRVYEHGELVDKF